MTRINHPANDIGPTLKCLLVDDSRFERRRIKTAMERAEIKAEFVEAASIGDTRTALDAHELDLVLLDNFLPDGQGLTLAEDISSLGIALILISDTTANGLGDAAIWAGCDAFLAKDDISPALLATTIREALAKSEGRRAPDSEDAQNDVVRELLNELIRDCVMQLDTPVARMVSMIRLMRKQIDRGDQIAQRHSIDTLEELCISIQDYLDDMNKEAHAKVGT